MGTLNGGPSPFLVRLGLTPGVHLWLLSEVSSVQGLSGLSYVETRSLYASVTPLGWIATGHVCLSPTRAIYFAAYAGAKERLNVVFRPESKKVHVLSAVCAGELLQCQIRPVGPFSLGSL